VELALSVLFYPIWFSAAVIASFSFLISNFVIPDANKVKLDFEEKYIHSRPQAFNDKNIHRQIEPGVFIYMQSYSSLSQTGFNFSMEKFVDGVLKSKLIADQIHWDTAINKWRIRRYYIRDINGMNETLSFGTSIDSTLNITPEDFARRINVVETMSIKELNKFIAISKMRGETNLVAFQIEKYKRSAYPFSTFILTLIGVAVSSKKVRGGIGTQLGVGLMISFSYILFMQFSSQFSIGGSLPPMLAVWLPNMIFAIVAFILYKLAPK
jgi:lipopolysaccharide export system permease protein